MVNINIERKPYGLSMKALEFLCRQSGKKVGAREIGIAIYGIHLDNPSRRVSKYILPSLCKRELIEKLGYGYYVITERGKRLVAEMGDD